MAAVQTALVVVAVHNGQRWLDRCLDSLRGQTDATWRALVVDDASTDDTPRLGLNHVGLDSRIRVLRRPVREGALASRMAAVRMAAPHPETVVLVLDGDDWLGDPTALRTWLRPFRNPDVWCAYGQAQVWRGRGSARRPIPRGSGAGTRPQVQRSAKWTVGHPFLFRAGLLRFVSPEDLRRADGHWYTCATDMALGYPLLELAGPHRVRDLGPCAYVYNRARFREARAGNPLAHAIAARDIRRGRPYAPLASLEGAAP